MRELIRLITDPYFSFFEKIQILIGGLLTIALAVAIVWFLVMAFILFSPIVLAVLVTIAVGYLIGRFIMFYMYND